MENSIIPLEKNFKTEFNLMKVENSKLIFDYETPAGEKAARSHCYRMRQSKTVITKAHKGAKAKALEFSNKLDAEKRRLLVEIDAMIAVHQVPLDEVKARRDAEEKKALELIQFEKDFDLASQDHSVFLEHTRIKAEAEKIRIAQEAEGKRLKAEAEKIRIAQEAETQRQAEHQRIQKDAQEKIELEKKRIELEKLHFMARVKEQENEKRRAAERIAEAERQKLIIEKRNLEAKAVAERRAIEAKAEAKRVREADEQHKHNINCTIIDACSNVGIENGQQLIEAILSGEIPFISINY